MIAAIITSRINSKRLPNKALVDIGGKPMLRHIVDRARQAKLVDKVIHVTGKVDKVVVNSGLEIYYIILAGAARREFWNVRCTFDSENASELSRITEGQTVVVQGKYGGYGNNIIVKECVVIR